MSLSERALADRDALDDVARPAWLVLIYLAGDVSEPTELAVAIRQVLVEQGRGPIDLIAGDTCFTQFLEIAYELDNCAGVLMSPQTYAPVEGCAISFG